MTLLELVVALAVGGTALAAGGAVFATLVDRRIALLADADATARALAARRTLVSWVSQLRTDYSSDGALTGAHGTQRTAAGTLADDALSVVTMADGTPQQVRLFVDRSLEPSALVAELTAADALTHRLVLASDIVGFEVTYLTAAFGHSEWRRSWGGALRPLAVQMQLRARDGVALPAPLQLPITIPLASSQ